MEEQQKEKAEKEKGVEELSAHQQQHSAAVVRVRARLLPAAVLAGA